jgi:hypothetical protein
MDLRTRSYLLVFSYGYEDKIILLGISMDIRTKFIPVGIFHIRIKIISAAIFPWITGQRSYLLLFSMDIGTKIIPVDIFPWI